MIHYYGKYRNYTLRGWCRLLYLKLTGKTVRVTGHCRMCGKCCRSVSLEANGRWLRSESHFKKVIEKYPEYKRFIVVGRDDSGLLLFTCSWYTPQGICLDHGKRPSLCRDYPHISLFFSDGKLPEGCGYRFQVGVPFKKVLQENIDAKK